jgi:putative ABC transport system substrate-binding protein
MKRRDFLVLAGVAAAFPRVAFAQQAKVKRIGILIATAEDDPTTKLRLDAIWTGLGKYGWSEKNLLADYRFNATTVDAALKPAADLIALGPDLLMSTTTPPTTAFARLTQTIPTIFCYVNGPTLAAIPAIQSFAHPGGNITGFANQPDNEIFGKGIDFLREMIPALTKVASVYGADAVPGGEAVYVRDLEALTEKEGLEHFIPFPTRVSSDISEAIRKVAEMRSSDPTIGLIMNGDSFITANRMLAVAEVAKNGLVAIWINSYLVADAGAMIIYSPDSSLNYRGAGEYAGLVLNGAKPGDLPIQFAFPLLVVNQKTARAMGIAIPVSILARADRVIE